jgi:hypothetical protein
VRRRRVSRFAARRISEAASSSGSGFELVTLLSYHVLFSSIQSENTLTAGAS